MTANKCMFLNVVATHGRSRPSAISAALQSGYALVIGLFCGRWTRKALGGGLRVDGRKIGGKNGKICGREMNSMRQRLRRFGRSTGVRTRFAVDYYVTVTTSIKSDPLALP